MPDRHRCRPRPSYGAVMDAHRVQVDPETHTVTVGAAVTRTLLRRLYGLSVEALVSTEKVNGIVVSRTYTARPAPPLVLAPGGWARQLRATVGEADSQLAAREADAHRAV